MHTDLIDQYAAGADHLDAAVAGLTEEELSAAPVAGNWTVRQVIAHIVDSDLVGVDRMKRVIAQERPLLMGYDESAYARHLHYDKIDVAQACTAFQAHRALMTALLRQLPPEAFERTGVHSERGLLTLRDLVADYVRHLAHHLKFLHEKRAALKKTNAVA